MIRVIVIAKHRVVEMSCTGSNAVLGEREREREIFDCVDRALTRFNSRQIRAQFQ